MLDDAELEGTGAGVDVGVGDDELISEESLLIAILLEMERELAVDEIGGTTGLLVDEDMASVLGGAAGVEDGGVIVDNRVTDTLEVDETLVPNELLVGEIVIEPAPNLL